MSPACGCLDSVVSRGLYLSLIVFLLFCWQDAKPLEVYSIEFMVDNNQLGFLGNVCLAFTRKVNTFLRNFVLMSPYFLCLLVSDRDKNLYVYMYLPEGMWWCWNMWCKSNVTLYQMEIHSCDTLSVFAAKESFGGMRLLRRADFNAGANINTFWRMPCRGTLDTGSKKSLTWDNKHITWFGTCHMS